MPNPYLQQSADQISRNLTQNLNENILPGINSGAIAAGGFGGSRQAIAQGLGIGRTQQAIGDAQTNLYSQGYNTDQQLQAQRDMQAAQLASTQSIAGMQNDTQRYGLDKNYAVNLGQLGLGQFNADTSRGLGWAQLAQQGDQNAFNNQLQGANFQLNGLNALQNWNGQGLGWANQQQQTPLQNLGFLSNIGTAIGNQGATASQPGASTVGSGLGGALTAAQIWALLSGANKQPGG